MEHSSKIKKPTTAFSLTELAIVITILGILIVGIGEGSRIINKTRLTAARSQTKSSATSFVKNLVAWYDATSENSFEKNQAYNNTPVDTWHDINTQSSIKNELYRDAADNHVQYKLNAINGLPALYFDGDNTDLTAFFYGNTIPSANQVFSFFAVYKLVNDTGSDYRALIRNGDDDNGWAYQVNAGLYRQTLFNNTAISGDNDLSLNPEIVSGIYDGTNFTLYVNGASKGSSAAAAGAAPISALFIGSGSFEGVSFLGNVGEIIIFDRDLENDERISIEDYLAKKWKINISR